MAIPSQRRRVALTSHSQQWLLDSYPQKLELYNLADDLEERNDLAKREPHKVRALESKLSEHLKTVGARLPQPGSGEKSD